MWLLVFLLGCYHGINPAMGWLFAVALGFQERSVRAVLTSIVPLVLGHIVSVAVVVILAVFAIAAFPHRVVHFAAAGLLFGFGVYRLVRARHPRWVGMRVGFWGLLLWGVLMSSAHGAGLMLLPFLTTRDAAQSTEPMNMTMPMPAATPPVEASAVTAALIVAVHALGYLLVLAAVSLVVYWKVGLRFLHSAWFNVDLIWALALIVTGLFVLVT